MADDAAQSYPRLQQVEHPRYYSSAHAVPPDHVGREWSPPVDERSQLVVGSGYARGSSSPPWSYHQASPLHRHALWTSSSRSPHQPMASVNLSTRLELSLS